jgi:hypothetical protein
MRLRARRDGGRSPDRSEPRRARAGASSPPPPIFGSVHASILGSVNASI